MAVPAAKLEAMRPLPLAPAGSVPVDTGVDFHETPAGGSVFLWGMAAWCWSAGDDTARRLAAVQLVESGQAPQRQVAKAFDVNETTLWRWRADYVRSGADALSTAKRGPRGPSKLTEAKVAEIARQRAEGASMEAIASAVGVSLNSVSRALRATPTPAPVLEGTTASAPLEPLARPEPRAAERQAARRGELAEAPPRITPGASLPLAGALVILPTLAATGLLDCVAGVYDRARAAFYGLRSLVLTVVFAALVAEPRAEGLTRLDPVALGRLLGLDRAPEVKTLRRRMAALAERRRADRLLAALAARHAAAHPDAMGVLYVDGHVRAYHGKAKVPKAHLARMRLSMPAEVDTWVADANGDGLLVWSAPPGVSLVGELRRVVEAVRELVGPDRRPTVAFDRGGWSPVLFAELAAGGFDVLTYRKGPRVLEPRRAFAPHTFVDSAGRPHHYLLGDRRVRIAYRHAGRTRHFACRQITRLDPASGHQTQVLTTRADPDPAPLAHAMFSRWRQENFFRYMRAHYALDALDAYVTAADDPGRLVPHPARRDADRRVREARAVLEAAEAAEGRAALEGGRDKAATAEMSTAFAEARDHVAHLEAAARAVPARVPLGQVHPDAVRLDPERKRIHDAIRMATYNAESALARLLAPHYARADDEARSLLREIFASPADMEVSGGELHVRINALSAPRRTRALAALCADLTATETTYPGTELRLVYSVKDA
ncbi:MAG TPA: helix-turn-helix domain-containing protein [Acidimicrobiales bacterium]|nr:helix-turn-helix domain-containing protein [Acidimicrobiales bacterium]